MSRSLHLILLIFLPFILTSSLSYGSQASQADTSEPYPKSDSKADWPSPVMDSENFGLLLFDLLEYKSASNGNSLNWDIVGWRGGDVHRLWVKTEGSSVTTSPAKNETDLQLLYGRPISPFFDAQIGARLEQVWGAGQSASRLSAAMGIQGLALYRFEFEAAVFVGEAGHLSARISANKDFLFTQKTIAQFRFETNGAAKRSDKFETGSGVNDLSLGLRLRYEIKREIAPYIGVSWTNLYGETANFRKLAGGESSEINAVGGFRFWY